MGKKKIKYICQPIEDVLARIKKSKKIIDHVYIEDHLYDRPNQCSLYYLKKHIQFVIDYDEKHGLSINVYKNDCFIEWAAKKNAECVARGILRWLRLGDIGNSQESLVIKEMKRNNIYF